MGCEFSGEDLAGARHEPSIAPLATDLRRWGYRAGLDDAEGLVGVPCGAIEGF